MEAEQEMQDMVKYAGVYAKEEENKYKKQKKYQQQNEAHVKGETIWQMVGNPKIFAAFVVALFLQTIILAFVISIYVRTEALRNQKEIGFSARTRSSRYRSRNEKIEFNEELSDFGNHFSPSARYPYFKCPVSGIYIFTLDIMTPLSNYELKAGIFRIRNGDKDTLAVTYADNDSNRRTHASAVAIQKFEKDDRVFVQTMRSGRSYKHCYFSGYLLQDLSKT